MAPIYLPGLNMASSTGLANDVPPSPMQHVSKFEEYDQDHVRYCDSIWQRRGTFESQGAELLASY